MTEFTLSGFSCRAEPIGEADPALVLLFSGFDRALFCGVCEQLRGSGCPPLVLAEYGEIDWDRDYSPWSAECGNGRKFSGGADRLLQFLPKFKAELERRYGSFSGVYLCGYSLGGLFALYAASCDLCAYSGAASCSGSMWFPGWTEFLKAHPLRGRVFLSLGGKEKNSPDPLMASVEEKTGEVKRLAERTAQVTFVHEAGGHFSRIPQRICRGITQLLT